MIQPMFNAERSLAPLSTIYGSVARHGDMAVTAQAACSGVQCAGTNETCCCDSKCVVTGMGCHCDNAVVEAQF